MKLDDIDPAFSSYQEFALLSGRTTEAIDKMRKEILLGPVALTSEQ